jgi:NTE family protein
MAVRLSKGPVLDAVLASAAIPGIFPPVRIDGRMLMDGAIAIDSPIRVAADLGACPGSSCFELDMLAP